MANLNTSFGFEFNNKYKDKLASAGLIATGINKNNNLVEVVEIPSHPWFVGVQFHPEYKSTVESPHPLFVSFVKASKNYRVTKNHRRKNHRLGSVEPQLTCLV